MNSILLVSCGTCLGGLWYIYTGEIGTAIAYFCLCMLGLDELSDREELEYLRNELKTLQEAHPHR